MENYVVTTSNNYINLDYISFGSGGSSSGGEGISSSGIITTTIDCSTNTITTAGTITYDSTTFTYDPSLQGIIDPTFDFNDWTYNPGFNVDLGDGDDVHYSHEEATEALKEHHNEKKLREEHKMLEKAYKEYKMLARLLQIDIEEED